MGVKQDQTKNSIETTGLKSDGTFASGITPYPAGGKFPVAPQANYWQGGNFHIPGMGSVMESSLLQRFPQLAALFGGQAPQASENFQNPGTYGGPPGGGTNAVFAQAPPAKAKSSQERLREMFMLGSQG